ncbi:MAG: hypothetical protein Q4C98_05550, partial [Capnocytophaga sp.]|nr:hypothetical protein [Capnocytophaga sp.]
ADWTLKPEDFSEALQLFLSLKKVQVKYELSAYYEFDFKDPKTQNIISCHPRKSNLTVYFGKNTQAMPEFWFAFTNAEQLHSYLADIEPFAPFKSWDMKAFRTVKPNKQGTANVVRKIKD